MKTRVLVADDHSIVLEGFVRVFHDSQFEVVGKVSDGRAVISAAAELKPDLVILDISMPLLNGFEAAAKIREEHPSVRLIFLSMHSEAQLVREAFRAGADVLKSADVSELSIAVSEVLQGRRYLSPAFATESLAVLSGLETEVRFGNALTPRQREVLQLVAEGRTAKEVANILNISVKTVEFHKTNIMDTLGLRSIAELTRYAVEHGIVST